MFTLHVKVTHEHNVSTSVVEVLRNLANQVWGLRREIQDMGLDFSRAEAAMSELQKDVQQILTLVEELRANAADPADQARLDAIAGIAEAADAAIDAATGQSNEVSEPPTE